MAHTLGVSRLTVRRGYQVLRNRRILAQRRGSGTFVTPDAYNILDIAPRRALRNVVFLLNAESVESIPNRMKFIVFDYMTGLSDRFQPAHINLCHFPLNDVKESEFKEILSRMASFDATVMLSSDPQELVWQIHQQNIPSVMVGIPSPWDNIPSVTYDRRQAAYLAAEHLVRCGYRRIGYVGETVMHERASSDQKLLGFMACLREHECTLEARYHLTSGPNPADAHRAMRGLIEKGDLPEAFFADTDYRAMEIIRALQDAGIAVPADVGVIGYDNISEAASFDPPLTTVCTRRRQTGERAADLLIYLPRKDEAPRNIVLEPKLIIRGSTHAMKGG